MCVACWHLILDTTTGRCSHFTTSCRSAVLESQPNDRRTLMRLQADLFVNMRNINLCLPFSSFHLELRNRRSTILPFNSQEWSWMLHFSFIGNYKTHFGKNATSWGGKKKSLTKNIKMKKNWRFDALTQWYHQLGEQMCWITINSYRSFDATASTRSLCDFTDCSKSQIQWKLTFSGVRVPLETVLSFCCWSLNHSCMT